MHPIFMGKRDAINKHFRANQHDHDLVRLFADGLLRENVQIRSRTGLPFLPYDDTSPPFMDCARNKSRSDVPCFLAGEIRCAIKF